VEFVLFPRQEIGVLISRLSHSYFIVVLRNIILVKYPQNNLTRSIIYAFLQSIFFSIRSSQYGGKLVGFYPRILYPSSRIISYYIAEYVYAFQINLFLCIFFILYYLFTIPR